MKRLSSLLFVGVLLVGPMAHAKLKVARIFGDQMVLQRYQPVQVWGWATPGEEVSVTIQSETIDVVKRATAGKDGRWMATLAAMKSDDGPVTMTVIGDGDNVTFKEVLIGEVWICSGQSNMEWPVRGSANGKQEIANANYPMIRLFNVPKHVRQNMPQSDAQQANWQVCSPQTVAGFSACGYYFGRELHKALNVPIGLIGANWGGTRIEPWTPSEGFLKVPSLKYISDKLSVLDPQSDEGVAVRTKYLEQIKAWLAQAEKKHTVGREIGNAPQLRIDPPGGATRIYNGMVAGLTPLSVRGVIWYQGESNAGSKLKYDNLTEALVKGWREVFQNDSLSFYWVGLAGYGRGHSGKPEGGGWGPVREGQRRALRLPNTGMAVAIDIGNARDIHPQNKQDVGKRLALWALAKDYGKQAVYSGPMYKSHKVKDNTVVLQFDHVGSGLMVATKGGDYLMGPVQATPGEALASFSLRDEAGKWHWADATIQGETVVVKSDKVVNPTAVRYAYDSLPKINLYNKEGLPAVPFTTVD